MRRDKFTSYEGDIKMSQCSSCAHTKDVRICDAFPQGIPMVIMKNKHDHNLPYEGDHGIRYEALTVVRK